MRVTMNANVDRNESWAGVNRPSQPAIDHALSYSSALEHRCLYVASFQRKSQVMCLCGTRLRLGDFFDASTNKAQCQPGGTPSAALFEFWMRATQSQVHQILWLSYTCPPDVQKPEVIQRDILPSSRLNRARLQYGRYRQPLFACHRHH